MQSNSCLKFSYYQPQSNRCGVNCDQKCMSKINLMLLSIMTTWLRYSLHLFAYVHSICLLYFALPWFLLPIKTKAKNQKSKSDEFRKKYTSNIYIYITTHICINHVSCKGRATYAYTSTIR